MHRVLLLVGLGVACSGGLWAQDTVGIISGGSLREVKVLTPYERWQKDTAENRAIHHKRLGEAAFKPEVADPRKYGLRLDGAFTWLALKISGKQKRAQKFKKALEAHETEQLFALRYNAPLVSRLTGLEDSAAYAFIRQHPMSRAFFHSATDLELMQWIRDHYRAWGHKPQ